MTLPIGTNRARSAGDTAAIVRRRRIAGAVFVLSASLAAIPCAYSAHAALVHNPIDLPMEKDVRAPMWLPQGWKFFTRDPKEEREHVYRLEADGGWRSISSTPNAEPSHTFGWDRSARAQSLELALLTQGIPESTYRACDEAPTRCLTGTAEGVTLRNTSAIPTICGSIGLVLQQPVPWAWAKGGARPTMPSRVLRARVSC